MKTNNTDKLAHVLRGCITNVETEYYTGYKINFKTRNLIHLNGLRIIDSKSAVKSHIIWLQHNINFLLLLILVT